MPIRSRLELSALPGPILEECGASTGLSQAVSIALPLQVLAANGVSVVRITGSQLASEPFAVIARLAQALTARAA